VVQLRRSVSRNVTSTPLAERTEHSVTQGATLSVVRALLAIFAVIVGASGQVRRAGQLKVFLHCAVDLDAGRCACTVTLDGNGREPPSHPAGKDDDFRLEPRGVRVYVEPRHGTFVAKATPSASGLTGCMAAQYSTRRLRIDGLSRGSSICVRTSERRFAELTVEQTIFAGADRALLSYSTWER
jgi:hypothetical protein